MHRKTGKIAILFISILSALALAEAVLRSLNLAPVIFDYKIFEPMVFVDNPEMCYKMKPFGECEGGRLNSEGFKDGEFDPHKDDNTIRIIMLGDSITKGTGVRLGETFSDRLEIMLNQKSGQAGSALKYDVMNFGVGGYNTASEIEVLKEFGLKYRPDIVVLNYFFNDNEEYSFNYYYFMSKPGISAGEKNLVYRYYLDSGRFRLNRLLLRSHLFTLCRIGAYEAFKMGGDTEYPGPGIYKESAMPEKIEEFKGLSERYGFTPFILMHPVLDYDMKPPRKEYESTASIAKAAGVPIMDLRAFYQRGSGDPGAFLLDARDNIHPNARGHDLIARSILNKLEEENIVDIGKKSVF